MSMGKWHRPGFLPGNSKSQATNSKQYQILNFQKEAPRLLRGLGPNRNNEGQLDDRDYHGRFCGGLVMT
jgi:hypothetical protein